jgi:hypothetical protein
LQTDFREFFPLFLNVVIPVIAGVVYFALAKYVHHIGPLRTLIAGELTYTGAFWGFLFLGIYLASRPLQILGPHPWPLIINNIREFFMIAIFGPAVFVAMMSFVFGSDNIPRSWVMAIFGVGAVLAAAFVVINCYAIGGSEEIFRVGRWSAHDGLWFKEADGRRRLMSLLFLIRFINPIFLVFLAGTFVIWHAKNYPPEKRALYDNMPRKLMFMGAACYAFSLSMLSVGLLYLFLHIPNQWWIYYVGALGAGLLETISLSLPMKRHVNVSDHL